MRSKKPIGKGNTLLYAAVVMFFMVWSTVDISYTKQNGWSGRTKDVPLPILTPCMVFLAAALGVNIADAIRAVADLATRNAIAINHLASSNSTSTQASPDEFENNSHQDSEQQ